jgi:histidinol-phosphate/aromatic aminotransferase/cobyric acid decarboxylase-like protein
VEGLKSLGFEFIDGKANFLAAKIPNAEEVFIKLQKSEYIVRPLKSYGMVGWLRLTTGTEARECPTFKRT